MSCDKKLKGYKSYNPKKKKTIVVTMDIEFDEEGEQNWNTPKNKDMYRFQSVLLWPTLMTFYLEFPQQDFCDLSIIEASPPPLLCSTLPTDAAGSRFTE